MNCLICMGYEHAQTHKAHARRHTNTRTLSIVTPPCHHFVQKVCSLGLITSSIFPHFGTTFKVFVEWPFPPPYAQPTTMELAASILSGNCTNPLPVLIIEDFGGDSGGVVGVHATNVARPFEDQSMIVGIPRLNAMCLHHVPYCTCTANTIVSHGLSLRPLDPEHFSDHVLLGATQLGKLRDLQVPTASAVE